MCRRFAQSFRRLGALVAGLALLVAAPACLAEVTFTYALPGGQKGVIVLPPVEEFENGDHWDAYAADATADMNANTAFQGQVSYSFVKTDSAWAQSKLDIQAFINGAADKGRHFKDIGRDPPAYPDAARTGQLFATEDGVLHRFDGARWMTIPVGSVLDSPDGKHLKVDRRVLPAEAARIDAAFQRAETAGQAEQAKADAQTQTTALVTSSSPVADPAQTPVTPKPGEPSRGGIWVLPLFILIIVGAWIWWWFGPRKAALAKAATDTPNTPAA